MSKQDRPPGSPSPPMPLEALVETSRLAAATGSRLAKRDAIAALLQTADLDDVETIVAYLAGDVRQGRIGIGWATLSKLRSAASSVSTLTLQDVDAALGAVVASKGTGSAAARSTILSGLLGRATNAEQDFLFRLLSGELRQGASDGVMLEAIASAARMPVADVRRAAMLTGQLPSAARIALDTRPGQGIDGLSRLAVQLNRPVLPMLAAPAVDVAEAIGQLGVASLEWKLDGARVQVHKQSSDSGSEVRVYTRALKDITQALPEVVELLNGLPVRDIILDGEAIAMTPEGRPHPFQVTMRRFGRKLDVPSLRAELPLKVYFFDCLYLDGRSLLNEPTRERHAAMSTALPEHCLVPRIVTEDVSVADAFYADTLARGHEGVMVKSVEAPYEAGRRGASWFKVKRTHTLDLVVLAAEWGHGRRKGWLSNLHLGARDPASPTGWAMLGKTFKGMTDAMLKWQTEEFLARELDREGHTVRVKPELVVEVAFNDIQVSPQYSSGLALRFARVKAYRSDKSASEADTLDTVRALHAAQAASDETDAA